MASGGFQFKQFYIAHDKCAMKVGTDSIILGSWADIRSPQRMLDIGTGSGLLAIMLAQKSCQTHPRTEIVAIEPELNAYHQAVDNVTASPWKEHIQVYNDTLQEFGNGSESKNGSVGFDLIISNPPYFEALSPRTTDKGFERFSEQRKLARHQRNLSLEELAFGVQRLLNPDGRFFCILPEQCRAAFEAVLFKAGLFIEKRLYVATVKSKAAKRIGWQIAKFDIDTSDEFLTIYDAEHKYTAQYKALCQDFYLNF